MTKKITFQAFLLKPLFYGENELNIYINYITFLIIAV